MNFEKSLAMATSPVYGLNVPAREYYPTFGTVLNLDMVPKAGRRAVLAWELPAKLTRAVAHVKAQQESSA
jgi:hypothetical protein